MPDFAEEHSLMAQGYRLIAGIDEVGRGPLAGPVAAAAVILPCHLHIPWFSQVRDSKQLTPARREALACLIQQAAIATGIGMVPSVEIDRQGIVKAVRLAMRLALEQLSPRPEFVLIDWLTLPGLPLPQKGVRGGDENCLSIAAASIVAKVARDGVMDGLDRQYPGYGFARNKGYGTPEHLASLRRLGPCPVHRLSFSPCEEARDEGGSEPSWEEVQETS